MDGVGGLGWPGRNRTVGCRGGLLEPGHGWDDGTIVGKDVIRLGDEKNCEDCLCFHGDEGRCS